MIPTIVGMSVVIVGLLGWILFLTIALYDVRDTAAAAIDAQTTLYMKLDSRLKAVEPREYPKYTGTAAGSEIAAQDAACEGIDPVWGEHDQAVGEALVHAQRPRRSAINTEPDSSAFFEEI